MKIRTFLTMTLVCVGAAMWLPSHEALCQEPNSEQNTAAILNELRSLKATVDRMQNDIQEIKASLSARPTGQTPAVELVTNVVLDVEGRPARGQEKAKLTMIEFSDYQCPFCRSFATNTFPRIEQEYIKAGKLKYYSFNFPLKNHVNAGIAARAALCANDQGKFWEMNESLLSRPNGQDLTRENLINMAKGLGMDDVGFQGCLDMGGHSEEVAEDFRSGEKAGVRGIPCFLLGFTNPKNNKIQVVRLVSGARPFDQFKEVLDELLSSQTP